MIFGWKVSWISSFFTTNHVAGARWALYLPGRRLPACSAVIRCSAGLTGKWWANTPGASCMVLLGKQPACGRHFLSPIPGVGQGREPQLHMGSGCTPRKNRQLVHGVPPGTQRQQLRGIMSHSVASNTCWQQEDTWGHTRGQTGLNQPRYLYKSPHGCQDLGMHSLMRAVIAFPHGGRRRGTQDCAHLCTPDWSQMTLLLGGTKYP